MNLCYYPLMKIWRDFWSYLPIKKKLILFFFFMIFCISLQNLYTVTSAFRYLDMYERELTRNAGIHKLMSALSENFAAFEKYEKEKEQETLSRFRQSIPGIWELWGEINEHSRTSREAEFQINALRYGLIAYFDSTSRVMEKALTREGRGFIEEVSRSRRIYGYMEYYLETLLKIRLKEGLEMHDANIQTMNRVQIISTLGIIIITLSFLVFASVFSESLTRPLRELARNSRTMAGGELNVKRPSWSNRDEIGILLDSFYTMSGNLHEMVESLKEKREIERKLHEEEVKIIEMSRSLREARFLSLQSQINPHFLFNTLNTISRMSLFEGAPKTVRLIESLANVFRHNLEGRNPIVPLKEEIETLLEYMHIQETRFGERLTFELDCPPETMKTELPVFTLQPLVENAIKYGIEPMEEGGKIRLSSYRRGNRIEIVLEDTGFGMSEEKIDRILNSGEDIMSDHSTGIGIANVRKRLSLAYEEKSRFSISSPEGRGTTITITLPADYKCIEF